MTPRYRPLHPWLARFERDLLDETVLRAVEARSDDALREAVSEVRPGVYTLPLLRPRACEALLAEARGYERWQAERRAALRRPNTMHRHGVVADELGLEAMLEELMLGYLAPFGRLLFGGLGGDSIDYLHGFVVGYGEGRDEALSLHVDDSEVTVSTCLLDGFSGGALRLRGQRCEAHLTTRAEPGEDVAIAPRRGVAVLHAGWHRHEVAPITAGERFNLVLWCRSTRFRRTVGKPPCGPWCGARQATG